MKIGVVVNTNARRHRGSALARRYEQHAHCVVSTSSLAQLDEAIVELKRQRVDVVALSGGDGAVHRGLTSLVRTWGDVLPRVAILPAGTMNTVARGLGVRGGPVAVLRRVHQDNSHWLLRAPIHAGQGRVGFLFGTGFWARFLMAYDVRSGPGPVRAAAVLAQGLASTAIRGPFVRQLFAPVNASVSVDEYPSQSGDFTMIAAGAVPQVGLGFAPFSGVLQTPDPFHRLIFRSSPPRVAMSLPRLFVGGTPQSPDEGGLCHRLCIEADSAMDWAMDGDVQQAERHLVLEPGPRLQLALG